MQVKLFEVRDRITFIPVFAFRCREDDGCAAQRYLLSRVGFRDGAGVMVGYLSGDRQCSADPAGLGGARTMPIAARYIIDRFDRLNDGDVIDVEFILGETSNPKLSERVEFP